MKCAVTTCPNTAVRRQEFATIFGKVVQIAVCDAHYELTNLPRKAHKA